ncbi:jg2245 [Pararge aegeria aegeria]|uniref:Jg2245 protein n=1 Tax=Pararge aegeria aegeria TaxID=348720 RepID=A0A8S4SPR5_9NEOP|nr:jg2245 [Pararge aegeria aegeria]
MLPTARSSQYGWANVMSHYNHLPFCHECKLSGLRHPNTLVVEASTYTPVPDVELKRRRPKHILDDPDDKITSDNVSQRHTHTRNKYSVFAGEDEGLISDVIRTWNLTTVTGAFGLNNN